ncbi:MAG: hypothetical protein WD738_11470 [Pirellulales bacterium]
MAIANGLRDGVQQRPSGRYNRYIPTLRKAQEPIESWASEAVTIVWTVSVTGAFVADLLVVVAHLYVRSHPQAQPARMLEAIMLLSAAVMGATSIALLPVVWRTRRLKPPQGHLVFAVLVAVAPVIALVGRLFS